MGRLEPPRHGVLARPATGSEAGFAAFDAFSRKSAKYDAGRTRARWEHYQTSPPDGWASRTLVYEARKADPGFRAEARVAGRTSPAGSDQPPLVGDALFDTSHDGLALDLGAEWSDARHVALWGQWLFYTGSAGSATRSCCT